MAHIFISYSRTEREVAAQLAQRLTEEGYDVWWDAALLGGTRFEDEITHVLKEARVAIILWSQSSAASDWVRAEAEIARHQKSALPVVIDNVDIGSLPILFQQIHTVELRNWNGSPDAPGYQQILKSIDERIGQKPDSPAADAPPRRSTAELGAQEGRAADEQAAWSELSVTRDATTDDYQDFLTTFPEGNFAKLARMRLKRLGRKSGRRRQLLLVSLALIAVVGVTVGLSIKTVRDMVLTRFTAHPTVATCASPDSLVQSATLVPISFCTESKLWHRATPPAGAPSALFFNSNDGMTLMVSLGLIVVEPDVAKSYIIVSTDTNGKATLTRESKRVVNGREWSIWEWTWSNATASANYTTYYASTPDMGSAAFTVYGPASEQTIGLYGDPILDSVTFGKREG